MKEVIFVDGTFCDKIKDDFYSIAIDFDRFMAFGLKYKNSKGVINLNLCHARNMDNYYLKLDTWKDKEYSPWEFIEK